MQHKSQKRWVYKGIKILTFPLLSLTIGTGLIGCSEEINPLKSNEPTIQKESEDISGSNNTTIDTSTDLSQPPNQGLDSIKKTEQKDKSISDSTSSLSKLAAEVRRKPSDDQKIRTPGVWNLRTHLDDDKINRANQLRNPALLNSYPELFGTEADFKPLLSMEGKGPGLIRIIGTNMDTIEFSLSPSKEIIEIYPYYKNLFLFGENMGAKEKLEITYIEGSKEELVDKFQMKWSEPREILLTDKNLNDIISLIEDQQPTLPFKFETMKDWLLAATAGLDKYNIKFEEIDGSSTFQRVRTSKEMREDKKATAYDLCVWLASKATEHGFECELIILPNHALIGVSNAPREKNELKSPEQSYIETKTLVDRETITQGAFEARRNILLEKVNQSIVDGQKTINDQTKLGSENITALKVEEWKKLYRKK